MNIYVITENYYLFTGVVHSLSSRMACHFIRLNPHDTNNYSIYKDSAPSDVYILAPENSKIDFSILVALNDTKSSVIFARSNSDGNICRMFRFTNLERVFHLSDLLQCIFKLKPSDSREIHLPKITTQERSVLLLTLSGMGVSYIGARFNMTVKTVYAHQRSALKKLGVRKVRDVISFPDHFVEYICDNV